MGELAPMSKENPEDNKSSDVECPTCDRNNFESVKGMKRHHAIQHNKSISGKLIECDSCGKEFRRLRSEMSENNFCSNECRGEWISETRVGKSHPRHKGMAEVKCEYCNETFEVYQYRKERARFCSVKCRGKWLSENITGEDAPRWNGGYVGYYGYDWDKIRAKAIERDGEKCVSCGVGRECHHERFGKDLEVHHIIPRREFESLDDANKLGNLVTYCTTCHPDWEGIPLKPQ